MLKKLRRRVKTLVTKRFKKPNKPYKPPTTPPPRSPSPSQPEPSTCTMAPPPQLESLKPLTKPFLFPKTQSTVLPDPSLFFSPTLLSTPLPTNSFFQNFTLKNGDQPE